MLDELGGFDEGFRLYGEDIDIAYRAAKAGWERWYVPEAVVRHAHQAVTDRRFLTRRTLWHWRGIAALRPQASRAAGAAVRPCASQGRSQPAARAVGRAARRRERGRAAELPRVDPRGGRPPGRAEPVRPRPLLALRADVGPRPQPPGPRPRARCESLLHDDAASRVHRPRAHARQLLRALGDRGAGADGRASRSRHRRDDRDEPDSRRSSTSRAETFRSRTITSTSSSSARSSST